MKFAIAAVSLLGVATAAQAQFVMMPDSGTNNRIVLFSPVDGSVVNNNYFALEGGTPVHAMQVGEEIWVSEQVGDRISRWSLTGAPLGQIGGGSGGGLDNIRGMALINGTVYLTNSGTGNGAPGSAIVSFDTSGNQIGTFSTSGLAPSPFGILAYEGGMLVSASSANDDVHQFTLTGSSLGTFHNSTSLNFAQQMAYAANGDILISGFSSNNVVRFTPTGGIVSTFPASGARGVYQLENGNIMWTNGSGAHVYDVSTGTSSLVYAGAGRYLAFLDLADEPSCPGDFDGDGSVGTADITAFLSAWFADRAAGQGPFTADFNDDGAVTTADITAFLSAWFDARAGGC